MSKNIFITGIAGFIGFHLASWLKRRGDHIVGIDNFNPYYDPQLKLARAAELKKSGITVIDCDINARESAERHIQAHGTTHLVHLAAQAGVRYSLESPESYTRANIDGFLSILEICRKTPTIQLIYASSSSVYGTNDKVPFSIEDRTDQQTSLYGVTKKANELMAKSYHKLFGIPVTGLRFFTVYGPWGRPDMAYYSFADAILSGKVIDVYGEGKLLRDFTYIDDIVAGICSAIDLGASDELFNLGNHQPVSVSTMIDLLEKYCEKKAHKRYLPMPIADVPITYADITHSQEKLQFHPKTSLSEGLRHFTDWFLKYRKFLPNNQNSYFTNIS